MLYTRWRMTLGYSTRLVCIPQEWLLVKTMRVITAHQAEHEN